LHMMFSLSGFLTRIILRRSIQSESDYYGQPAK
jgi:hypothetical protein